MSSSSPPADRALNVVVAHLAMNDSLAPPVWIELSADRISGCSHELKPLSVGDLVVLQDPTTSRWIETGRITGVYPRRRYAIRLGNGVIGHRKRKFIRSKAEEKSGDGEDEDDDANVDSEQSPRRSQ